MVATGAWKSTATPPVADSAAGSGAGVSSTSTTGAAAAFFAGALRVEALRVVFFTTGFCSVSEAISVAGSVTGSAATAFLAGAFFAAAVFLAGAFFAAAAFLAGALRVVRVTTGGVSAVPTPSAIAPCEVVSLVSVWSESSMSCSSGTWCGAGLALPRIRGPGGRKASVAPTPSA